MRTLAAAAGLALLALVWALPLGAWLGAFPGHMLRHVTLVALAAPLLVLGIPALGRAANVGALAGTVAEAAIVWAWHLPALHHLAHAGGLARVAEQASFLLAGLLVWAGALAPGGALAGAMALLLTSMHMTMLGALLILAPKDLYGGGLDGQQAGGIVMLAVATPVYLLAGLALVRTGLGRDRPA